MVSCLLTDHTYKIKAKLEEIQILKKYLFNIFIPWITAAYQLLLPAVGGAGAGSGAGAGAGTATWRPLYCKPPVAQ